MDKQKHQIETEQRKKNESERRLLIQNQAYKCTGVVYSEKVKECYKSVILRAFKQKYTH